MKITIDIPDEVVESGAYCAYFGAWSEKLQEAIENGEERKTGKWLVVKEGINTYRVKCSNCGIVLHTGHGFDSKESYMQLIRDACDKYCHDCGAEMEVDNG